MRINQKEDFAVLIKLLLLLNLNRTSPQNVGSLNRVIYALIMIMITSSHTLINKECTGRKWHWFCCFTTFLPTCAFQRAWRPSLARAAWWLTNIIHSTNTLSALMYVMF